MSHHPILKLSRRHLQIIELVYQGKDNGTIAHKLGISIATVKVHMKVILEHLGLTNRTQLAVWWWHTRRSPNDRRG